MGKNKTKRLEKDKVKQNSQNMGETKKQPTDIVKNNPTESK